jgi:hypothetical protein
MFCQQTLKREFETASVRDVVLAGFITFRDQTPNQELALRGSETGRIATVDLSKASDRISLSLVKAAFGANQPLLERMLASRSGDSKVGDEVVSLKKYASMGNATTFPVQTFIFLGIVLGCCLAKTGLDARKARDRKVLRRSVRVFGDDILVPVEVIPVLLEVLTHYGLRVNTSKSFWTGWFRESCGMDAYRGVDVTPTYVRQLLGSQAPEAILSRIACANLMHARGWWQTARFLTTLVPSDKLAVVGIDSGEFGLHSFVGSSCRHLKKRWSKRFQCQEVKCLVPKDKANTVETNGWARLLRNFNEAGEIRSREFFTDESFLQAYRTSVSLKTLWVHRPK